MDAAVSRMRVRAGGGHESPFYTAGVPPPISGRTNMVWKSP